MASGVMMNGAAHAGGQPVASHGPVAGVPSMGVPTLRPPSFPSLPMPNRPSTGVSNSLRR